MNRTKLFCQLYKSMGKPSIILLLGFFTLPFHLSSQSCFRNIYRSMDGTCNNIRSANAANWGAANRPFYREMNPAYSADDIFNGMNHSTKPNPRAVSNVLFNQNGDTGNAENLSSFVFTWGQFIDHDITFAKGARTEYTPIPLPADEPLFTSDISFNRSAIYAGTGIFTPRNQENALTAWIDGSQVYGSDEHRANWLRTFSNGKLKMSSGNLLTYNTLNGEKDGIIDPNAPEMDAIDNSQTAHFVAGDVRANEQPGLTTLHILFSREHNRICDELVNQGYQDDETIYQIARKKIGAMIQAITYQQFLPALGVQLNPYIGYNNLIQPDIMNIFAAAAYRIGHTMVTSELLLLNDDCSQVRSPLSLEQGFFNTQWIENFGVDPLLKGLATQQQEAIDHKVVDGLRNFLFAIPQLPGTFGLDLAALNIQRGRDHGLPDYRTVRQHFIGDNINSFSQINSDPVVAQQLATLYNNDLTKIDLWVGLLAEEHFANGSMGRTMHNILKKQFEKIRNGDYYYYQNDPFISPSEKLQLQSTKLGDIIKRNTNLANLSANIFYAEPCQPLTADCNTIEINSLTGQIEIKNLIAPFTTIKVFDKNADWTVVGSCTGQDCGETQVFDLLPSEYLVEINYYRETWRDLICQKRMDVTVEGNAVFSCENVSISADANILQITGLKAPFNTVKVFDKNGGWHVVANCIGTGCGENPTFNLPSGEYYVQISAYQAVWQNLICTKDVDVTIGSTSHINCESVNVTANNGTLSVDGLIAPFCTVKVFDLNQNWAVVAECIGDECAENQLFTMSNSRFNVEVTFYEGFWQNELCRKNFQMDMTGSRTRSSPNYQASIFPNPTQNLINISLKEQLGKATKVQLINQFGQAVKTLHIDKLANELIHIPITDLTNGWYYLTMQIENNMPVTEKILVSRLY